MLVSLIKDLFKVQKLPLGDELARARQHFENSEYEAALSVLGALLERQPSSPDALLLRAIIKRLMDKPREALVDLVQAQELGADPGNCHFQLALCWFLLGDNQQALAHCEKARELVSDSVAVFTFLAQLQLPGEYYFEVVERIIAHLAPKTYVEIGVFQGASLRLATSAVAVVGIDPDPKIGIALPPHVKVFKSTSDAFFAAHDLGAELGGRSVDLAFIDGMHQFEFAMRDFANVERFARKDSVILIHDCYPLDEMSAGREPRAHSWSGDIWRLIVLLKKYRPDLVIHTIGTAPTGLAVIQNLDPQSTYLLDNQDQLQQEFLALEYSYLKDDKASKLNLFPNEWSAIARLFERPVAA